MIKLFFEYKYECIDPVLNIAVLKADFEKIYY